MKFFLMMIKCVLISPSKFESSLVGTGNYRDLKGISMRMNTGSAPLLASP